MATESALRLEDAQKARQYLRQVTLGDADGLKQLYQLFGGPVFSICMRILRNREQAEEVVQDTFIRVWKHASEYDESRSTLFGWIVTIARRRAIDQLRYASSRPSMEYGDDLHRLEKIRVESERQQFEDRDVLDYELSGVSALQRICLEAVYFEGLTQVEVASRLGKPLGTVKSEIRRGLQRLKEKFRGE